MKRSRIAQIAFCGTLFLAAFATRVARADDFNDRTIVKFSEAVQVPGATLPAGTYIFKVLETEADRVSVQISNEREDHVYAIVLANHNHYGTQETHREDPLAPTPGKTVITFYEAPVGQPQPIKTWFYPGQSFGFDFIYTKGEVIRK